MSGCEDESGLTAAAKQVRESVNRTAKKLDKEHQTLVQLRSLVEQQLRVLQAEEVTIQRLIRHHSSSSKSTNDRRESRSHSRELEPESSLEPMEPDHEPSQDQLPRLDLDVNTIATSSAQDRSADFSEEENESDISDE